MKLLNVLLFICVAAIAIQCNHKQPDASIFNEVNGIITGQDYKKCACCGGWIVKVDSTEYLFNNFPDDVDFNVENETLPLSVTFSFELDPCLYVQRIKVLSMHKL